MQKWTLIFALIAILIVIMPIIFRIKLSYNFLKNIGFVTIKIFKFKVIRFSFHLQDTFLVLKFEGKIKKISTLSLNISKEQIVYIDELSKQFKDKLKFKLLSFYSRIGTNDAFSSAMISASLGQVISGFFAFIKNFKQTCTIMVDCYPVYNKQRAHFVFSSVFAISIYDLIYCFVFALIRKWRYKKSEKRHGREKFG